MTGAGHAAHPACEHVFVRPQITYHRTRPPPDRPCNPPSPSLRAAAAARCRQWNDSAAPLALRRARGGGGVASDALQGVWEGGQELSGASLLRARLAAGCETEKRLRRRGWGPLGPGCRYSRRWLQPRWRCACSPAVGSRRVVPDAQIIATNNYMLLLPAGGQYGCGTGEMRRWGRVGIEWLAGGFGQMGAAIQMA